MRGIANESGALLYVDAAQLAGALAIDVVALGIDALAAPAHKFLIGTRAMGYAYFAPALREAMKPVGPGWKAAARPMASFFGPEMILSETASRFDQSLAWIPALGDVHGLRLLAASGIDAISARNLALADRLRAGLKAAGVEFHDFPPLHGSTIVSVAPTRADAVERLASAGVVSSARMGRVRLAVHIYYTEAEIDRAVEALAG